MDKKTTNKQLQKTATSSKSQVITGILLFFTGFFLAQAILSNILYSTNPLGGWITAFGSIPTSSILFATLVSLGLCLSILWFSLGKTENKPQTASAH